VCPPGVRGSLCSECAEAGFLFNAATKVCENVTEPETNPVCKPAQAVCSGDPHCSTFDGSRFDFMGTCEYTLVHTFCTDKPETIVQVQQSPWPQADSAVSVISAVAMQENNGAQRGAVLEVRGAVSSGTLSLRINGVLYSEAALRAAPAVVFTEGVVQVGSTLQAMVVIFRSGQVVHVGLQAQSSYTTAMSVAVDLNEVGAACGCTEGLLGYMDADMSRDYLLPAAGYRRNGGSSAQPLALSEFASIPSVATPSFAAFGEMWRLHSAAHTADVRLFSGPPPALCNRTIVPPSDPCPTTAAALQCCRALAGQPEYVDCITDFCATGHCLVVDPPGVWRSVFMWL
jgi:hypothetical protein